MKLNVDFVRDENGTEKPVITDDRGDHMPCICGVDISVGLDMATKITITLVVDRKNVTLGRLA